ncbi:hypothetical protein GCM10010399_25190 [Dactylosporangium fulvum]|uniref:Uncharacterized protein n=1 Tax=Dactylosporangium fulvum TaxID=53359 RepID=A0ABY5W5V4_9ACTN|nr:hypothetical protein [Dactylosporangium fulvum]UWP85447.1 hypothetical protein Dfulv_14885 [Dactylosporangium fulvum]
MALDGALGQEEPFRDLSVVGPGGHQAEHLQLALAQRLDRAGGVGCAGPPPEGAHDPAGDAGIEPHTAAGGDADGADEVVGRGILEDEPGRPGLLIAASSGKYVISGVEIDSRRSALQ